MLMRMWSDWDGCKIAMRYCHTSMSFQKGVLLQWQTIFHTTRGFWNQWRMIWTMCFIKSGQTYGLSSPDFCLLFQSHFLTFCNFYVLTWMSQFFWEIFLVFQKHLSTASELLFGKRDCWFRSIPSDNSLREENRFQFLNFVACYQWMGVLWSVKHSGYDVKVNHDVVTDVVFCSSLKTRIQKQYPNAFKDTVAALDTDDHPDLNVPQWCHIFEFSVQKTTCIPQIDVVSVLVRVTSYSGLDTQFFILVKEHQLIWRCKVHTCDFSNWCAINGAVAQPCLLLLQTGICQQNSTIACW